MHFIYAVIFFSVFCEIYTEDALGPTISISLGKVQPVIQKSRGGREFHAFLGIPYASPPVHFLRFKVDL